MNLLEARRAAQALTEQAGPTSNPYFDDPAGFAKHILGVTLTPYQTEALTQFVTGEEDRVTIRGPRGLGKTMLAAVVILWFASTREIGRVDWKIVVTSGSWLQLRAYLWPEVHKWALRMNWSQLGIEPWSTADQLMKLSIHLDHGLAVSASPERAELIEGAHAAHVLVVFDEAKSIPQETFDAIEGVFSNVGYGEDTRGYALAVSTPGAMSGEFYRLHTRQTGQGMWWVRHVKLDEAIAAGQVTDRWANNLADKWGCRFWFV